MFLYFFLTFFYFDNIYNQNGDKDESIYRFTSYN